MAFTIKDLVYQAREVVQDLGMDFDYDGDRHTDAKIIRILNTALADAYRLRADLFYPNLDRATPSFTEADIAAETAWPYEDAYFSSFVDYVAGYIAMGDDEFSQNERAVTLLNRFTQKLTAKGA